MVLIASLGSPSVQPKRKTVLIIPLLANADLYLSWSSLERIHPDKHHLEELTPQGISATGIPGPRHHWSSCWVKPRQPAMLLMALIGTSGLALWNVPSWYTFLHACQRQQVQTLAQNCHCEFCCGTILRAKTTQLHLTGVGQ